MDRAELEQANHEELIELVQQLHEALQDVRETNRELTERVDAYDISCFDIDWQAQSVTCPQAASSRIWS